jgi:hypothetical protein
MGPGNAQRRCVRRNLKTHYRAGLTWPRRRWEGFCRKPSRSHVCGSTLQNIFRHVYRKKMYFSAQVFFFIASICWPEKRYQW